MVLNADLLKYFFGASLLDEIGEDSISALIEQYPYFVHPHWISVIKKWNVSHHQLDLQDAGIYTFSPFRVKQYCAEASSQMLNDSTKSTIASEDMGIETSARSENDPTEDDITLQRQKEESMEPLQAYEAAEANVKNESAPEKQEVHPGPVIQPLFTQDYFAYTGAKLPEQIENDKKPTMEQLRSFTGWLRTMKRSTTYSTDPDSGKEKIIPDADEEKYDDQEAVTETMAEVRASMGHYDKAIVIYEKLSLSNPEKSAYFAQKIEGLKNK